jgi:hypothetical protein
MNDTMDIHYEYLKLKEWTLKYENNWKNLSLNPNAISILESNIYIIDWDNLSLNPNAIFLFL